MLYPRSWVFASVVAVVGVTLLSAPVGAQEPQSWIHVQIVGTDSADGNMALNLPLSAVSAVVSMAPEGIIDSEGRLMAAEENGVSVGDIRQMWRGIKDGGDVELVAMQQENRTVRVSRAGDQMEVRVDNAENDETVRIDLPVVVVDALLSGDGDTLNIPAAIEQLGQLRGDVVRVTEAARQIRVWIDEQSVQ